ncbi:MAG: pantoate--beta-alanine ligase [Acidobacteriaceae bacterium]|jgi:pantoate--beta-alanine ligase|nr:pantoate--beta-alanine ligase [Acidobacteriaceae bacterium]
MKEFARKQRDENRIVGLVPTMGALHPGHLSLIKQARQQCSSLVASIFVNPTQFGPSEDFAKYPRALPADSEKLENAGVQCLFLPEAKDIYPPKYSTYVDVEGLSERLEGRSRPGHFRGVSTVVMKLLQIVQPQFAYFGRKDAQQAAIISRMATDLNLDTEIEICPIEREADGLAMSSRNVYLQTGDRQSATVLHRSFQAAQTLLQNGSRDALSLQSAMHRVLKQESRAKVDYVEIVDAETFEPLTHINRKAYVLLAVKFGETRLLDNMLVDFSDTGELNVEL